MWVIYSLITAILVATSDALTKRALVGRDEYFVAWVRLICAMPALLGVLMFVKIPPLDRTFWIATFCSLPLEITALVLYTKALKVSPISVTVPFLAFTPLFLIVTSRIIVGEGVSFQGGIGILLMVAGSYTLNIHRIKKDLFEPIKAIAREKGSVFMIMVAFIYSITSSLGKVAIEHSSPVFFGAFYFFLVSVFFTPIVLAKKDNKKNLRPSEIRAIIPAGMTYGLMIIFHMIAMDMSNVAYMISIKRTSLLFSMIYGYFMFREERIGEKTIGAILMLAGFMLIVLS